jgi:hypothetical protein
MKHKKALRTIWQRYRPGVDAVLSFATMEIESALQVEGQLSNASVTLHAWAPEQPLNPETKDALQKTFQKADLERASTDARARFDRELDSDYVYQPFKKSADPTGATYRKDQKTLRRWLSKIIRWEKLPTKDKTAILREILPWTELSNAKVRTQILGGKALLRVIVYDAPDVQHVIGEAMYLLFQHGIAQEGGISVCPECDAYFMKDRTDQKVCSNRCRQRQYRRSQRDST